MAFSHCPKQHSLQSARLADVAVSMTVGSSAPGGGGASPRRRSRRWRRGRPSATKRRPYAAEVLRSLRSDLKPARTSSEKKLRLLPGREVPAFVELVVVDQFGIRPLRPAPRGCIDLVRKDAHGNRDGDAFDIEKPEFAQMSPSRDGRRRTPYSSTRVTVMLSSTSSRVRPSAYPSKTRAISS